MAISEVIATKDQILSVLSVLILYPEQIFYTPFLPHIFTQSDVFSHWLHDHAWSCRDIDLEKQNKYTGEEIRWGYFLESKWRSQRRIETKKSFHLLAKLVLFRNRSSFFTYGNKPHSYLLLKYPENFFNPRQNTDEIFQKPDFRIYYSKKLFERLHKRWNTDIGFIKIQGKSNFPWSSVPRLLWLISEVLTSSVVVKNARITVNLRKRLLSDKSVENYRQVFMQSSVRFQAATFT